MTLDKETKEKIDKLPLVLRLAANFLVKCIERLADGECDEEEIISAMNAAKDHSDGRYCKDDLMNYDEAGRELGFGVTNRVGLKKLLDANNIQQVKIGSTKIGFPRSKILWLKKSLKK